MTPCLKGSQPLQKICVTCAAILPLMLWIGIGRRVRLWEASFGKIHPPFTVRLAETERLEGATMLDQAYHQRKAVRSATTNRMSHGLTYPSETHGPKPGK
jgi:hypothetical protein